ncbi:MAG: hypothetical protein ABEJ36_01870 [Candidatus Nanosalina sp.]
MDQEREVEKVPDISGFFGGPVPSRGWNGYRWESPAFLFRNGFREETTVHESLNSTRELEEFVRGIGRYSDRNSFFYDEEDFREQSGEGFFADMHCPECIEDNLEADIGGVVDSRIFPDFRAYEVDSFKYGEEKYRGEIWYQCDRHPDVYLMQSKNWYEE